ncbi:MAG: hypothetical protein WD359_04925 [Dehalococcoidia bacterium]
MAISSVTLQRHAVAIGASRPSGRWKERIFHLLAATGAVTVIVGAYLPWATFYAGLIERNGVPGHGKYFIALAVGALIASALSSMRGLAPLRSLTPIFGVAIAAFAVRDLRNLYALTDNPAAAFYVPGQGPGLYVVIAGATLLAASYFAAPRVRDWRMTDVAATGVAAAFTIGVTMLIAGAYGEYYLHFAGGHAHNHTDALNPAHVLTFSGGSLLFVASSAIVYRLGARRRPPVARRSHDVGASDV